MRLRQLFEATNNEVAIIFGRFNPPHKGHKAAWEMASKSPVWYVGTNQSTVGPKDPLPYDVKVEAMKTVWPEVESHIVAETSWLTLASEVYKDYPDATLLCLTDEDWVTKTIQQYNGKEGAHGFYNFKNITQRPTPRLSSATALRDAVSKGDRDAFTQAAGVSADTEVAGKPFFDLVAEYLLPYQNAPKKVVKKKVAAPVEGLRGTGNPGMPTPYDQGLNDAKKGRVYDNPYNQPGEEQEHSQYKKGYEQGKTPGVAEGSEQVYKVIAVDKSNYLGGKEEMTVKADSIEDLFSRLSANDWYPLEINGVEVIAGKRLKQGVAEAGNGRPGTTPGFQDTLTADEKRRAQRAAERQAQDKSTKSGIDKNRAKADAYRKSGVAEGLPQTLRKVVPGYAKREIDKKMDAEKFGRRDVDKDANFHRYKKIQDKLK
jgi:hypothetical protein